MSRRRTVDRVLARDGELVVERDPARPTGRLLLARELESSYIDLADETHLEFDYLRWIRIVLRAVHARRVVHIGGGACALARALACEWPDGRQEVCELDSGVLELARRHMGLRRMPGLRVRHADGRQWLSTEGDTSWDAVVIDAFLGARIPRRLITAQALGDVARVAPLGLVNVVDNRERQQVATVAAGLAEAFPHVWSLGGRSGNTVVAGAASPLALAPIAAAAAADPLPATLTGPAEMRRLAAGTVAGRDPEPV
jgi:protein-L-isoaspartate O-methyltransferase